MFLLPGKLPNDLLEKLIEKYTFPNNSVIVGPSIGEDAAAIDIGDRYLLAKTDPITFVTEDIGTYAICINANDIATMGGKPRWFLATILLPEGSTTPELAEQIFSQLSSECRKYEISLCGGHTEITIGLNSPIVIGLMIGEVSKDALITTGGAREGDDIILTKGIAIEAVSIIAREKREELTSLFGERFLSDCSRLIETPGLSVVRDAEIAVKNGIIHSMHDPTEGGLATGLYEVARASDKGIIIELDSVPVMSYCKIISEHYGLDPLGLIASGALLITLGSDDTENVLSALRSEGIAAVKVGEVLPKSEGMLLRQGKEIKDLPRFERDEITKLFL
jgi:hydrogenase maturation factor